jgi:membrane protease YdiL (CAAX protease family)
LHFQLNVIIFTSIFGIILSYIYYKSQSLWPCYITHVLKNLIAVIFIYAIGFV